MIIGMTTAASERKQIHRLPDALINKIAAGEVVERPASVVKELLENAIDAGARRIAVTIEDGGRTLIRISDDGHGMSAEEAPLAFAQHATSKISSTEDLFAITTMGFRGEALASIASVSHCSLTTRTADASGAIRIDVKDSLLGPITPCAAPPGTTIEVRDLFYSVPARRKFLRTDSTEFSHIHEMLLRSALPNPHIAFSLHHNMPHYPRASAVCRSSDARRGSPRQRRRPRVVRSPAPHRLRRARHPDHGFRGPTLARPPHRKVPIPFSQQPLHPRPRLLHALKESYRGLIEPSAQPVAILFLNMDPTLFNVNVHPQKTEVRFRDSGSVYRPLLAAIREKLLSSDLTPQVRTANRFDRRRLRRRVASGQWRAARAVRMRRGR